MGPTNSYMMLYNPMAHGVLSPLQCPSPMEKKFLKGLTCPSVHEAAFLPVAHNDLLSRTHKLIVQITQVCKELRAIKKDRSIKTQLTTHSQLSNDRTNKERQPSTCEKDERGCTRSKDNRSYDRYVDPHNSLNNPARHAEPSPCTTPPSGSPSPTSSHASSPSSSSSVSEPSFLPSCDLRDSTFGSTMALSSSQKETKEEESEEQDSRGGGPPCPSETSEWRSRNKAGTGDLGSRPRPHIGRRQRTCNSEGEACAP